MPKQIMFTDVQGEVVEAFFDGIYHCGAFDIMKEMLEEANDEKLNRVLAKATNAAEFLSELEAEFGFVLWEEEDDRELLESYQL